jgi:hypothetical protein
MYKLIVIECEDTERNIEVSVSTFSLNFDNLKDIIEFIEFFKAHTSSNFDNFVFEIVTICKR